MTGTPVRRWPLRRLLAAVFGVIGVVVLVLVALIASALMRLEHARTDRVERYGPALLATESLAKAYSDQETGVRGFVASGDAAFLEPYRSGRRSEGVQLRQLEDLLAARPDLLRRVHVVRARASTWRQQFAEPAIRTTQQQGPRRTTTTELDRGKQSFDDLRAALGALHRPVAAARDSATAALDDSVRLLVGTLVASLVLILALGFGTWVALRRWVTGPLAGLGREVDVVEAGELGHPVTIDAAPEEIAELAEQVERMRVRIVTEVGIAERSRDEARRAQALVEEQALDLQRSNTELEQFAYVASHDLQEPLRKVASFCQLLERRYKGQLDERGEQYIEFAVDGAKRMQQLINDLLAFSRVGRLTNAFTPVDLNEALAQAERQLASTLEEAGARVTHGELPTVMGEGTLLVQLLQNLVGNAVKFRGDDPPTVHLDVRRTGDDWEISCADNGIGIDPRYADKIFVIFQRLHGRDVYGGTGIGLAMCKKIVEYHGGHMWLDTEVTTGATFRWTLPVVHADDEPQDDHDHPATEQERTTDDAVSASAAD